MYACTRSGALKHLFVMTSGLFEIGSHRKRRLSNRDYFA
jgi:hypothetical protein